MTIRFLTGYGPQEDAAEDTINKFYAAFEEELIRCEEDNCGFIAELDFNAKLGMEVLKGDPNAMSENGKLMWDIVQRHECTVVNTTELCKGTITRSRMKKEIKEESVLDYVIINARIQPFLQQMEIDEAKTKALARFQKGKAVTSDHNTLTCTFNIPVNKKQPQRIEVYRLRNEEELLQYRERTTHCDKFTRCFTKDGDIVEEGKKWMKEIDKTIKSCFKKIRIRPNHKGKQSDIQKKLEERKNILKQLSSTNSMREKHKLEDEINKIEENISEEQRQKQLDKVREHLNIITDADGNVNTTGAWKLRKKIFPKPPEQLSSKKDKDGNLITNPDKIKEIYLQAYTDRLKHREILPGLEKLKTLREQLFYQRLSKCKINISPPWTMQQLDKVLSKLKHGKATDPTGLVNELFMLKNIGTNLKESLLILVNKIKCQHKEPNFMEMANITSFWKHRERTRNLHP